MNNLTLKTAFVNFFSFFLQSLIEKHFPAPDRSRIQQILARQGLIDSKPKSLLDELGIVVPSSNGSSSASSSTRDSLGKRKANRQAAQKFKKKAKVSSDDDSDSSNNEDHGSGSESFLSKLFCSSQMHQFSSVLYRQMGYFYKMNLQYTLTLPNKSFVTLSQHLKM